MPGMASYRSTSASSGHRRTPRSSRCPSRVPPSTSGWPAPPAGDGNGEDPGVFAEPVPGPCGAWHQHPHPGFAGCFTFREVLVQDLVRQVRGGRSTKASCTAAASWSWSSKTASGSSRSRKGALHGGRHCLAGAAGPTPPRSRSRKPSVPGPPPEWRASWRAVADQSFGQVGEDVRDELHHPLPADDRDTKFDQRLHGHHSRQELLNFGLGVLPSGRAASRSVNLARAASRAATASVDSYSRGSKKLSPSSSSASGAYSSEATSSSNTSARPSAEAWSSASASQHRASRPVCGPAAGRWPGAGSWRR